MAFDCEIDTKKYSLLEDFHIENQEFDAFSLTISISSWTPQPKTNKPPSVSKFQVTLVSLKHKVCRTPNSNQIQRCHNKIEISTKIQFNSRFHLIGIPLI
ncbi:hypothetical protein ISN44_As01g012510 [Arabidopsis suecica]|uniref:Uncharacterized protein n=1 Tax=Arabidopsis suecica TaxID=45249 RepID=A0A8T2H4Q2_ARASU|nr:hypothetical protein ISN44_As01g012510 [Arabidopsis suecica]